MRDQFFILGGGSGPPKSAPGQLNACIVCLLLTKNFKFPFAPPALPKIFHLHPPMNENFPFTPHMSKKFPFAPPECRIHRGGSEGCLDPWDEKLISHRTNCKSGGVNEISVRWVPYGSRCESKWFFLQQHVSSGNVLNLYLYIFSTLVKKLAKS